jgi:hypothetical protein
MAGQFDNYWLQSGWTSENLEDPTLQMQQVWSQMVVKKKFDPSWNMRSATLRKIGFGVHLDSHLFKIDRVFEGIGHIG